MLPSTGHFKDTNCPFFDSGLCERPYCHFRHVKKEPPDSIPAANSSLLEGNGEMLQQLVSEAVKKVLQQTEMLPGALGCSSGSKTAEVVPHSLVTKVVEELTPPSISNAASTEKGTDKNSEKKTDKYADKTAEKTEKTTEKSATVDSIPSYKPTPIAMLKKRHIPIPYSPALSKAPSITLKRRNSSDTSSVQKKPKVTREYEPDPSNTDKTSGTSYSPTVVTSKSNSLSSSALSYALSPLRTSSEEKDPSFICHYDPYDAILGKGSGYSSDQTPQYSPVPVCGWKDNTHSYTPSNIESLNSVLNDYVPSSKNPDHLAAVNYEPSEKSKSSIEPAYVPLGTDGSAVDDTTYKPSRVSNVEPEYQPHYNETLVKEYVPTDISKLDVIGTQDLDFLSRDLDLLHDILNADGSISDEETEESSKQEQDNIINRNEKCQKAKFTCNGDGSLRVKSTLKTPMLDVEKDEKKKNDSRAVLDVDLDEKLKNVDRSRTTKSCEKGDIKKKRDSEKHKSDSSRKRSNSDTKQSKSGKTHFDSDKRRSDMDKKSSGSEKKHSDIERKRSDSESDRDRKRSDRKHSEHDKKRSSDKKNDRVKKHSTSVENEHGKLSSVKISSANKYGSSTDKQKTNRHAGSNHNRKEASKEHRDSRQKENSKYKSPRHIDNHNSQKEVTKHHSEHKQKDKDKRSQFKSSKHHVEKEKKKELSKSTSKKLTNRKGRDRGLKGSNKTDNNFNQKDGSKHRNDNRQRDENEEVYVDGVSSSEVESNFSASENSDEYVMMDRVALPSDMGASSSEEDVTKECFRIFQEYEPAKAANTCSMRKVPDPNTEVEPPVLGKKRIAHEGSLNAIYYHKPVVRTSVIHPVQMIAERMKKAKEAAQAAMAAESTTVHVPSTQSITSPPAGRIRIAHVPNVSLLLNAKLKVQERLKERQKQPGPGSTSLSSSTATIAQSTPKGVQRIAHVPSLTLLKRPIITEAGGKIPTSVRQNYLNVMTDECLKIYDTEEEAFERAVQEEKAIHSRSTTRIVYSSLMSNCVNRLRKSAQPGLEGSASTSKMGVIANRMVSHNSVLAGKGGSKGSWSIEKPKKPAAITAENMFEEFARYLLTEDELKSNGFPCPHPEEKGVAIVHAFYKKPFIPQSATQRHCARCSCVYYVNKQGFAVKEEQCIYHWGRMFQGRVRGVWESRYVCCQGPADAIGCSVGGCHVTDNFDPSCMRGFVKTFTKDEPQANGDYGIYALDCEMCYTTGGLELTRVTVIGRNMETVYETLVKPENSILDYNTRFSGITEADMENVTTNIYEVQSALLSFISDKTILVGHSLESDFKALKIIHSSVVDTSVVFPHKHGPPKKKALKTLCRELLHKLIQESEAGHDSAEDAKACMELMLYKIKEDFKKC